MAIGGDATQGGAFQIEQQTVEVITHILLRHGEGGTFDQFLQCGFRHTDTFDDGELIVFREIPGRQGGQGVSAFSGLDGGLVAGMAEYDFAAIGQGAHDVEKFAGGNGDFTVLAIIDAATCRQLHFEIRAFQTQLPVFHLHQQIAQHRKGLSAFNHIHDLLQGFQKGFTGEAKTHSGIPMTKVNYSNWWWW